MPWTVGRWFLKILLWKTGLSGIGIDGEVDVVVAGGGGAAAASAADATSQVWY